MMKQFRVYFGRVLAALNIKWTKVINKSESLSQKAAQNMPKIYSAACMIYWYKVVHSLYLPLCSHFFTFCPKLCLCVICDCQKPKYVKIL